METIILKYFFLLHNKNSNTVTCINRGSQCFQLSSITFIIASTEKRTKENKRKQKKTTGDDLQDKKRIKQYILFAFYFLDLLML